jgi:YjbE family integral membrane protein
LRVGSPCTKLRPGALGISLPSIFSGFGGAGFWIGVPQIALVNVVLSGDTAVVIALACRGLPPARRPWGIAVGAGTAALLLLTFAVIVAPLLAYPYVKLIGGFALIYIAIKLLVQRSAREEAVAAATNLSAVVRIVLTADIILGLDNVIALAGIARGNFALLVVGLAISLPIILAGAALFMKLLDRFPFLVWAGAALLGWVGGDIIANDSAVSRALTAVFGEEHKQLAQTAAAGAGALLVVVAGAVGWRLCKSKSRVDPPSGETV